MSSAGNAGQPLDEPRDEDRSHRPGNSLPALRRVEGARDLVIPSVEELDLALARADSVETIGELERMLGLLEEASRRFELAIDDAIQVAAYHLRAKRKLGGLLAQTVKWGGDRARSHDATLPPSGLPQWLDKHKAARLRRLAAVTGEHFEEFLHQAEQRHVVPREAAALRYGAARRPRLAPARTPRRAKPAANPASPSILDTACRLLGAIDVSVGPHDIGAAASLAPASARPAQLHGTVLITHCPDPTAWLPSIAKLHATSTIQEVVVLLPAALNAPWFQQLAQDAWLCCFPAASPGTLVLHLGRKKSGFRACFSPLGVVFESLPSH